jgi:hypothetical protein
MHPPPPAGYTGIAPPDPAPPGAPGRGCGNGAGLRLDTFDEALAAREVVPSLTGPMPPPTYANPEAATATPPHKAIAVVRCLIVTVSTLVGSSAPSHVISYLVTSTKGTPENELPCVVWPIR